MAEVRLEMSREEFDDSNQATQPHEVSPHAFLCTGFELEEQQYVPLYWIQMMN